LALTNPSYFVQLESDLSMKFLPLALASACLSATSVTALQENLELECAQSYDANSKIDYFPHKVAPEFSNEWSIEYQLNYKIITNRIANETYLMYQCGTPPPEDLETLNAKHTSVLSVPVTAGIAFTSGTQLGHLEVLGLRQNITMHIGNPIYLASDCLLDMIANNTTDNEFAPWGESLEVPLFEGDANEQPVVFRGAYDTQAYGSNLIRIDSASENTNAGTFEWHKVYAAMFNLEKLANEQMDEREERYECVSNNAALIVADGVKPTVIWAYWNSYGTTPGWALANCPNYYCEYATKCDADLINTDRQLNMTEFASIAKDADHWIYPSTDFDTILTDNYDLLSEFKSVKNGEVYDYQGRAGRDNWFGDRMVSYDIVLEDFCEIVGTGSALHQRRYFRKIDTEAKGNIEQCTDVTAPLAIKATECIPIVSESLEEIPIVSESSEEIPNVSESSEETSEEANKISAASSIVLWVSGLACAAIVFAL